MKRVAFATLGCKTNQYETDALMDLFHKNGDLIVDFDEIADLYIINTCTVTQVSDRKSRQMIRRAKKHNPDAITVAMGCYAQISPDEIAALEGVDLVLGTNDRHSILKHIAAVSTEKPDVPIVIVEDISKVTQFEELTVSKVYTHTRAFIKIQEGCNQFCSYCIIPYARGRVRSRKLDAVVSEVKKLVASGYVEFVLTGIHIGSYGIDFKDETSLIDLIEALNAINGVKRIRLGSLEPRLIDDAFVHRLSKLDKVCDHFHLSLQSGSNQVLKKMNRKYTREDFLASVRRLKQLYNAPAITTDIIVGFPGETEKDFEQSLDIVDTVAFSELHVFPFSPRKGTPAAKMDEQCSGDLKKERSEKLIAKGRQNTEAYQTAFVGHTLDVLIEEFKDGFWIGHTTNYLKLYLKDSTPFVYAGSIVSAKIETIADGKLIASVQAS
ncbi:tRNA (N(6)-L-threonylcarbamoyladenosine(37)-C(2))-methylthiotransferase MtaB [Fusibacter paucivorans]|uniref:tRNA (N(6)-L-threonylcarbamoyladenosine(37)-C(2))-methylthiotransferase n=1 Tax=Fusibacter paucivorans TaxID=76009 RepID=A0ABS5PQT0_9FIRM|nr:tRNA (N(6)-L-threonylcarbamoyladenosine(37)-C(2))-methylthiotransferase MtaB [Fusibacter paucivorans]MBS7526774.1 tRNA (N(6)-L-threonylcarbamoyladenosine(37)-C(2))-methylthiotransferase MtaB [Fusibacter paucivorans]